MITSRAFFFSLALVLLTTPALAQQQGYSGYSGGAQAPTAPQPVVPQVQNPYPPQSQNPYATQTQIQQPMTAPGGGYYPHVAQPTAPTAPTVPAVPQQPLPNAFDGAAVPQQDATQAAPAQAAVATTPPAEPPKPDPCAAYMQSYDIYVSCKDRIQKIERMKEAQTRRNAVPEPPKVEEKKAEEKPPENPNIKNQKGFIINKIKK